MLLLKYIDFPKVEDEDSRERFKELFRDFMDTCTNAPNMSAFTETAMALPIDKLELTEFYGYMNYLIADFEPTDFHAIFSSVKSDWYAVARELRHNRKLDQLKKQNQQKQDELEVKELNKAIDKGIKCIQDMIFDISTYKQVAKDAGINELRQSQIKVLSYFAMTAAKHTFIELSTAFGKTSLQCIYADAQIQLNPNAKMIITVPNDVLR